MYGIATAEYSCSPASESWPINANEYTDQTISSGWIHQRSSTSSMRAQRGGESPAKSNSLILRHSGRDAAIHALFAIAYMVSANCGFPWTTSFPIPRG